MLFQQAETIVEQRETAKAEQVHFEEAEIFEILLVPLDDRAVRHRRVLDRNQPAYRLVAQKKTAGMDREMAGKVEYLVREPKKMAVQGGVRIETCLAERSGGDFAVIRQNLRQPIQPSLG